MKHNRKIILLLFAIIFMVVIVGIALSSVSSTMNAYNDAATSSSTTFNQNQ